MLTTATYARGRRHATISIERIDTFLEYTDTIVNFPGIVALDSDRLVLSANHARHGEVEGEPLRTFISEDGGAMWTPLGLESPFLDAHPLTGENHLTFAGGNHGYMRDGTITHIDVHQVDLERRDWNRREGPLHAIMQTADPTFRWRRWSQTGEPLENRLITLQNAPWETGSYENYARILELGDGELLTAMGVLAGAPPRLPGVDRRGRAHYDMRFSVGIIRSHDNGATWEVTAAFHPWEHEQVYGLNDRPVDEGFDEADLEIAANSDLVLIMRSGSYSPLFQTRSTDGGETWSEPENVGWPGVKPRLHLLPGGVLACISGRGGYGHPQVTHVILSLDGAGHHWEAPFAFHTGPGCSYTSTMVKNGQLHVVFSHSDFTREMGTNQLPSQRIRRAVISVEAADD